MVRPLSLVVLCGLLAVGVSAQEHGTVVAVHIASQNRFIPGQPGGNGVAPTSGVSVADQRWIYRVETDRRVYELEDWWTLRHRQPAFAVSDTVEFRIEKNKALIRVAGKDRKYKIVGEELKPK